MSLSGEEWQKKFIAASNVNDLCDVLDQTSNSFDTVTAEIIGGFFTAGISWLNAAARRIRNSWHGRNRYKNLYALWQDVRNLTNKICDNPDSVAEVKKLQVVDINIIKNCVSLTLALCARTHQDVYYNYKRLDNNNTLTRDQSRRSRWNESNRGHVLAILDTTTIEFTNISAGGEEKTETRQNAQSWFTLLASDHLKALRGSMGPYIVAPEGIEVTKRIAKKD